MTGQANRTPDHLDETDGRHRTARMLLAGGLALFLTSFGVSSLVFSHDLADTGVFPSYLQIAQAAGIETDDETEAPAALASPVAQAEESGGETEAEIEEPADDKDGEAEAGKVAPVNVTLAKDGTTRQSEVKLG